MKTASQKQLADEASGAPTPERARRGKFERVVPDDFLAGGGRKVWRDVHADPVMRLHAQAVIGDEELAAAVRFARLARLALGPVRLAASGLRDRVDGAEVDGDALAARHAQARAQYEAACAALRGGERRVLLEILYFGQPLGQAAAKLFGARWRSVHACNGAASALIQSGLEGLVRHWGLKGG